MNSDLVRSDFTGCIFPDCYPCQSGMKGGSHTRKGPVYEIKCVLCEDQDVEAIYTGETGYNAYHRGKEHKSDIENDNKKNAMAKHLSIHHPEKVSDPSAFQMKVKSNFSKPLDRQVYEGVLITNSEADFVLNSKSEFLQPSVTRITTTREVDTSRNRGL